MVQRKHFSEWRSLIVHWTFRIVIKNVKVCKDMTNTSYIWGCYHTITNHTIYLCRGTTSTVYFICKSRTSKTESISRDTSTMGHQIPVSILRCLKLELSFQILIMFHNSSVPQSSYNIDPSCEILSLKRGVSCPPGENERYSTSVNCFISGHQNHNGAGKWLLALIWCSNLKEAWRRLLL